MYEQVNSASVGTLFKFKPILYEKEHLKMYNFLWLNLFIIINNVLLPIQGKLVYQSILFSFLKTNY